MRHNIGYAPFKEKLHNFENTYVTTKDKYGDHWCVRIYKKRQRAQICEMLENKNKDKTKKSPVTSTHSILHTIQPDGFGPSDGSDLMDESPVPPKDYDYPAKRADPCEGRPQTGFEEINGQAGGNGDESKSQYLEVINTSHKPKK